MHIILSVFDGQAPLKSPCPVSPCHASAISMSGVPNQSSLALFLKYWGDNLMFFAGAVSTTRAHANTAKWWTLQRLSNRCLWWAIFSDWGTVQLVMWHSYSDFIHHHYRWWAYFHVEYEKRHLTLWSMVWGQMFWTESQAEVHVNF